MASLGLTSWAFVLLFFIGYVLCSMLDYNVPSDFVDEAQFSLPLEDGKEKTIKRRQNEREWCFIPPPMKNGKYRPSRNTCPPHDTSPACKMLEGAIVFPNWPIFLDYCNPGYVVNTTVAVCIRGRWSPTLPSCEVCPPSDTLVNGKTVCKGDVVFEDTFSEPLSSKWVHYNSFALGTWKFNEFTSDKKNSFTRNGSLVIKPTVRHESYVTSATVVLERCSGNGSDYCERTGSPDKILPPVATASLSTWNSFSFTYGEVEIRAKFPKGDWLMPELTLIPKQYYYGHSDTSGRIGVGVTLGNSDLRCGTKDYGLRRMENLVVLGPESKRSYWRFPVPKPLENWDDHFHTYTVIWKPGSIAFKVDNELVGELTPAENTLCETSDSLTKEDCMVYSRGSKIAPYDKDFYIALSLPVGVLGSETDGCINRGKVTPWKFNEPQEMLKFWQDRENWLSTWTEEGSSLYIDYVRVTAV